MVLTADKPDPPRIIACLIAGKTMLEGAASSLRYLQVALSEEGVETIVVVPEHRRVSALDIGPTTLVTFAEPPWILRRWARRKLVREVAARIESQREETPVVIHAMDLTVLPHAVELAAAISAELAVTVSTTHGLDDLELLTTLRGAAMVVTPSTRIAARWRRLPVQACASEPSGLVRSCRMRRRHSASRIDLAQFFTWGRFAVRGPARCCFARPSRRLNTRQTCSCSSSARGPAEGHWRQVADTLGIRSNVIFTGNIDNWRSAMKTRRHLLPPQRRTGGPRRTDSGAGRRSRGRRGGWVHV